MIINHLEPRALWGYFEEICKIPRLSKNEEKIIDFLKDFASENELEASEDSVGNILISKKADPGFENRKSIVLQSHMDMVGEKDADTDHNWLTDPITPIIEGDWVCAKITTLGADDGIGMAAQMALLTDKSIKSGRIEALFTVDEESGMTGAINLEPEFFKSSILINLDSEDEGELFIGCAGGIDTCASFKFTSSTIDQNKTAYLLSVTGLHGGHSGDEIHNGYANSVKILTEVLSKLDKKFGLRISHIDAGNLRNAIPREAFATVYIKKGESSEIFSSLSDIESKLKERFAETEPGMTIGIKPENGNSIVLERSVQENLLKALSDCPHGVIDWSSTMKDLVETSTNLASVKIKDGIIKVVTSQRSSVEDSKNKLSEEIATIFRNAGAEVTQGDGYPGWEPDTESEILKITSTSYQNLFEKEAIVRAIHAGLECGLILKKYPGLDMISFGPTIKGAHTPEERINIKTTQKFWDLLLDVVNNIPDIPAKK